MGYWHDLESPWIEMALSNVTPQKRGRYERWPSRSTYHVNPPNACRPNTWHTQLAAHHPLCLLHTVHNNAGERFAPPTLTHHNVPQHSPATQTPPKALHIISSTNQAA